MSEGEGETVSLSEATPVGAIHNIGYRAYDGARLGRRGVAQALFAHSLRGVFGLGRSARSKVIPIGLFVVVALPALIIAIITVVSAGQAPIEESFVEYTAYAMFLQAAIAIFVAVQAPQLVSLDMRYATLPLYLSRPLARKDYVIAKLGAMAIGLFIMLAVPLLILFIGDLLSDLPVGEKVVDLLQGLVGVAIYSLVLASVGVVVASFTGRRGFGVAGIITTLALSYAVVSGLQGFLGYDADNMDAAGWVGLFSPTTLVDGVQVWLFDASPNSPAGPSSGAGPVFLLVTILLVTGCVALLLRRYRKVRL